MANNNFKAFAAAAGANVMAQADYEALAALLTGFVSGTAQSIQLNKVWRQSSIMAAVLAQFIVDITGQDAIDDGTTTTLLANLKVAVLAQSVGVVGAVRNGRMYVAAASSSATYTADEVIVETMLGGLRYGIASLNKAVNLATTGAGGMDTGGAPANGYVALYAIYNPVTKVSALLATNATSSVAPSVYGGANMPAGYTASGLLSVVPTNGSGQFAPVLVRDRNVGIPIKTALTTNTVQGTLTSLSIASIVPQNAVSIAGELSIANTSTATVALTVASDATPLCQQNTTASVGTTGYVANFANLLLSAIQTIYWGSANTTGTPTYNIYITSYTI
ncbi:hypothetical protein WJ78_17805 [Burkholderia ubonensis]|uniref:hypothetical protein n=1 Tax=Burkholderia ubonensis TaxID=101571 RepID=UPI00075A672D|nr:hypothetical protein [Burkholderia ubonensis]KVO64977.1 hypothetical protein WJ78_17805 [Burkholderia ubonensis]KVP89974.1 hypothetical protein WJ97_23600 [Burkholderia ubonensis]